MNPAMSAVRIGLHRGWTEFRQQLTRPGDYAVEVVLIGIILTVLFFQRDSLVAGTGLSLAALTLPGVVGMLLAFETTTGAASAIAFEREDGTLLRAKAAPHGIIGYVTGHIVRIPLLTTVYVLLVLVPGLLLFDGLATGGAARWWTFLWVLALGLLATLPLGLALGAPAHDPRAAFGWIFLVSMGLIAISGIFYPITALPGWVQAIGQIFPYYWLGLGMRSALLPDTAAVAELTESWRHLETAAVLGGWAMLGLLLAPILLSRTTRGVSGSTVETARQKAAQRIG